MDINGAVNPLTKFAVSDRRLRRMAGSKDPRTLSRYLTQRLRAAEAEVRSRGDRRMMGDFATLVLDRLLHVAADRIGGIEVVLDEAALPGAIINGGEYFQRWSAFLRTQGHDPFRIVLPLPGECGAFLQTWDGPNAYDPILGPERRPTNIGLVRISGEHAQVSYLQVETRAIKELRAVPLAETRLTPVMAADGSLLSVKSHLLRFFRMKGFRSLRRISKPRSITWKIWDLIHSDILVPSSMFPELDQQLWTQKFYGAPHERGYYVDLRGDVPVLIKIVRPLCLPGMEQRSDLVAYLVGYDLSHRRLHRDPLEDYVLRFRNPAKMMREIIRACMVK